MLVLRRKESQSIHIGDDIVVTVCKIDDHGISIGIDAPIRVKIVRTELMPQASVSLQEKQATHTRG